MPAAGLEPARGCPQQILSLPRLPFRHAGFSIIQNTMKCPKRLIYNIVNDGQSQLFFHVNSEKIFISSTKNMIHMVLLGSCLHNFIKKKGFYICYR